MFSSRDSRGLCAVLWSHWVLGSLVYAACPTRALADNPAHAALSWVREPGAETCSSGPELALQLEAQVGRAILVALPRAELTVEGSIRASPGGFATRFRLIDRRGTIRGEREVVARVVDCRALDGLLVFILALLVDPDAPLLPPELPPGLSISTDRMLGELFQAEPTVPPLSLATPTSPRSVSVVQPEPTKRTQQTVAARDAERDEWHVHTNLDARAVLGLLPKPGTGLRLTVDVAEAAGWRFELGGTIFFGNELANDEATLSALLGEAAICHTVLGFARTVRWWACAHGSAGMLSSHVDANLPRDPVRTLVQIGIGQALTWELGEILSVRVGIEASIPLLRDTYYLSDETRTRTRVFRVSSVVVSASLGLSAALYSWR
jgi:hypothetical protein